MGSHNISLYLEGIPKTEKKLMAELYMFKAMKSFDVGDKIGDVQKSKNRHLYHDVTNMTVSR